MVAYALAVASEADDSRDRELGPIHLLKYLYLGDLAFAEENGGSSYSGAQWKFHKFGPWSADVYRQLSSAAESAGAAARRFHSAYAEDGVRWRLAISTSAEGIASVLPPVLARAVRMSVKAYKNDTYSLLHHVYRTGPMLSAAPGEVLVFQPKAEPDRHAAEPELPSISKAQLRKMREKVRAYLAERRTQGKTVSPQVSYDRDYFEIVDLLDKEPGKALEETNGVLEFSDDVWKSEARRGSDIS